MKSVVAKICEAKERARQVPVLATELELKRYLTLKCKISLSTRIFERMLRELEADDEIVKHRTIHGRAYTLKQYDEYAYK